MHRPTQSLRRTSLSMRVGLAVLMALPALILGEPASAQSRTHTRNDPPARSNPAASTPPPSRPAPALVEQPMLIPSLGMSLRLPEDALVDVSSLVGTRTTLTIWSQLENENWNLTLFNSISADHTLTTDSVIQKLVADTQRLFPAVDARDVRDPRRDPFDPKNQRYSLVRIIEHQQNLLIGPNHHPAQRVYMDIPANPDVPAWGYTVFNIGPGQFVIAQLESPQAEFPDSRLTYETIVASIEFRDPAELSAERAAPLFAGHELLELISTADLTELVEQAEDRFFRVYKPAVSGSRSDATEVAWQHVSIRTGQLGELDPRRPRSRWSQEEREYGFIVQVDARAALEGSIIDSQGVFWLSRDRQNERWSVRNEVKSPRNETLESQAQTIVRHGKRLKVMTESRGREDRYVEYTLPERGYISKVESYLLAHIVAAKDVPGAYAFYNYDLSLGKVTLRYESFEKTVPAGAWKQSTRVTENAAPISTVLDREGAIVRQEQLGGQVMVPSTREEIRRLWPATMQTPTSRQRGTR